MKFLLRNIENCALEPSGHIHIHIHTYGKFPPHIHKITTTMTTTGNIITNKHKRGNIKTMTDLSSVTTTLRVEKNTIFKAV